MSVVEIRDLEIVDERGNKVLLINIFCIKKYIWGIVSDNEKIVRINIDNYHIEWLDIKKGKYSFVKSRQYGANFATAYEKDNFIYLTQMAGDGIYKIDATTHEVEVINTRIEKDMFDELWGHLVTSKHNLFQERVYTLPRIVNLISKKVQTLKINEREQNNNTLEETVGYKIWEYIITHT